MRSESRSCVLTFPTEEKILRDYLPEDPTDADILNAIISINYRMGKIQGGVAESMWSIIEALRSKLHGL